MKYGYAYQRSGGPLMSWKNGPPRQSGLPTVTDLGSLGDATLELPLPGAPEPLAGMIHSGPPGPLTPVKTGRSVNRRKSMSGCGCGCGGAGGCSGSSMGDVTSFVTDNAGMLAAGAAVLYLLTRKKKRR